MQMTMSPEVEASLPEVEATVISLLASVAES
jgi:hypothetical protein